MKDKLEAFLENQKAEGERLSQQLNKISSADELDEFLAKYDRWNGLNAAILDKAYVHKTLWRMYTGVQYLGNIQVDSNSFQGKRDRVLYCLPKQLVHLRTAIAHTRDMKNIDYSPLNI